MTTTQYPFALVNAICEEVIRRAETSTPPGYHWVSTSVGDVLFPDDADFVASAGSWLVL